MAYNYNITPKPQSGSGTYGAVPGVIDLPPNIYSQVADIPGASNLAPQSAKFIGTELAGQISPEAQSMIQQKSALAGIRSGMPGGSYAENNNLLNLGLTSEGLQRQGTQDYLSFLGGTGAAMTNPNLAFEVAQQNALDAAAPNPAAAAAALMGLSKGSGGGISYSGPAGGSYTAPTVLPAGGWDPNAGYSNPPIAYGPGGGPGADVGFPSPQAPQQNTAYSSDFWNPPVSTELGSLLTDYTQGAWGGDSPNYPSGI